MNTRAVRISGAAAAVLFSLAALPAHSADMGGTGMSLIGSFVQMLASLAVVIGVIMLFSHLASRWLKNTPSAGVPRYIRLVETRHLGPKKSLMLVEVGGEYFLLGNSAEGMQLIKQVDMLEEIEVVGSQESPWGDGPLRTLLGKITAACSSLSRPGCKLVPFPPQKTAPVASALPPQPRPGLQQGFAK